MKKLAFASAGVILGFAGALALFPAAHGATNALSAYRELDLFGDAFELCGRIMFARSMTPN